MLNWHYCSSVWQCGVDASSPDRMLLQSSKPSLHTNVDCTALVAAIVNRQVSVVRLLLQVIFQPGFNINYCKKYNVRFNFFTNISKCKPELLEMHLCMKLFFWISKSNTWHTIQPLKSEKIRNCETSLL